MRAFAGWRKATLRKAPAFSTEVVLTGFGDKLIMLGDKGEGRAPAGIERGGSLAEELDEEIPFGPEHR
jgi:hypothetical protein